MLDFTKCPYFRGVVVALMSQADFGKLMGVTRQRVNQWVADGVIELVHVAGKKRGLVDSEKAKAAVEAARDPSRKPQAEAAKRRAEDNDQNYDAGIFDERMLPERSLADMTEDERAEYNRKLAQEREALEKIREEAKEHGVEDFDIDTAGLGLNEVKVFKELYLGKKAQAEYRKQIGELVERVDVEREAFEEAQRVRSALLSLPHKLSVRIVALTDPAEIEEVLDAEIRQVLEELSGGAG